MQSYYGANIPSALRELFNNDVEKWKNFKRLQNQRKRNIVDVPKPFVKWSGNKRSLIPKLSQLIPSKFNNYIEPFVGGGSLFFYLLPSKAVLIDLNEELINAYKVIQSSVLALINSLRVHKNEESYYYQIRNLDRSPAYRTLSAVERASRLIYLNKTCYNGLYRVNSKGHFNVPFGKYKNPNFCDVKNLIAVSFALQGVKIIHGSFERCVEYAAEGDFVYLDPPHLPNASYNSSRSHQKSSSSLKFYRKLYDLFSVLDQRGCYVMLTTYNTPLTKHLYEKYNFSYAMFSRFRKKSTNSSHSAISHVIITNY